MISIADGLRELREDAGLNAKQLAAVTGWHRTKVSKIEHATRRVFSGRVGAPISCREIT